MPTREQLSAWATDNEVELTFFDPPEMFDAAIVGLVHGYGQAMAVLYDEGTVMAALIADGMDEDEAQEWFHFNTIGGYHGEATPRFLIKPTEVIDEQA